MRKSLLAPQRWDAGKEHSSIDVSSESEAKVLWVICGSVRYYCCGTTSFSLKNRLKSDLSIVSNNWSPIDNYQILHVSPFSSFFLSMRRLEKWSHPLFFLFLHLLHFYFFIHLMKTPLASDCVTPAGHPYTHLHPCTACFCSRAEVAVTPNL